MAMMIIKLVVLGSVLAAPGCFWFTTKKEGNELRSELVTTRSKVDAQEATIADKMKMLETVIEQATKVLQRSSADIGDEVGRMEKELREVRGLLAETQQAVVTLREQLKQDKSGLEERVTDLDQRLEALAKRIDDGLRGAVKDAPPVKTAEELFALGKAAFDSKDYAVARDHFKDVVAKYKDDKRAGDAQYYRGEAYYREDKYNLAIGAFQVLFRDYAKNEFADDAMFRAAEAAEKLKQCTEARTYLDLLKRNFPKSSLLKKATQKDKQLKGWARDEKKCVG